LVSFLKPSWDVLDIGSGAGFPGLPLKIALPSLTVTLIEARQKRVAFLKEIKRLLNLKGIEIIQTHIRPDTLSLPLASFDAVFGRAVAPLPEYIRLALPFVKEEGLILSMLAGKEPREALEKVCQKYSVSIAEQKSFMLPFSDIKREIIGFKILI
jgi:16S rRNA (guanine527-N7)-methyltransferase